MTTININKQPWQPKIIENLYNVLSNYDVCNMSPVKIKNI